MIGALLKPMKNDQNAGEPGNRMTSDLTTGDGTSGGLMRSDGMEWQGG